MATSIGQAQPAVPAAAEPVSGIERVGTDGRRARPPLLMRRERHTGGAGDIAGTTAGIIDQRRQRPLIRLIIAELP